MVIASAEFGGAMKLGPDGMRIWLMFVTILNYHTGYIGDEEVSQIMFVLFVITQGRVEYGEKKNSGSASKAHRG